MAYKDKEKQREYMKKWRKNNPKKVSEHNKKYRKSNQDYNKEWIKNNPNYMKEYYQKPEVKIRQNEHAKTYGKKYPKKIKARDIAIYYLKHLKKPGFEFHHPDYSQPLLVEVLPMKEHRALHTQLNNKTIEV